MTPCSSGKDTLSSHSIPSPTLNHHKSPLASASTCSSLTIEEIQRPTAPLRELLYCYLSQVILILFGLLNDLLRTCNVLTNRALQERDRDGYVSVQDDFANFYYRNVLRRVLDMWGHPVCSVPGARIEILERSFSAYNIDWHFTDGVIPAINMGSYNYLGYAENVGPITDQVEETIKRDSICIPSVRNECGTHSTITHLERQVAQFIGLDDAIVVGMGFATNTTNIPALFGKGTLVISDELNHASMILGRKLSHAKLVVFKHNDMVDLESKLRHAVVKGQDKTHRPWKKIILMVEGIYSMEGTMVNLPEVIRLKKRYKCYIYLDEAHSIGALGPNGRGVVDYFNCDVRDVDIMMGTFTKSFGAAGGYIAGRKDLIDYLRISSHSFYYASPMSPSVATQISGVLSDLMYSPEGKRRIDLVRENTRYFRDRLFQLGYHVAGDKDSPVVPLMLYIIGKMKAFVAELYARGIASTGAAFPVTHLNGIRARFCISAGHTREMLDEAIAAIDEVGRKIQVNYRERIEPSEMQEKVKKKVVLNGNVQKKNGVNEKNGIIKKMNGNGNASANGKVNGNMNGIVDGNGMSIECNNQWEQHNGYHGNHH